MRLLVVVAQELERGVGEDDAEAEGGALAPQRLLVGALVLILLWLPETGGRELEEISHEDAAPAG